MRVTTNTGEHLDLSKPEKACPKCAGTSFCACEMKGRADEPAPGTDAFAEQELEALRRMRPRVAAVIERAAMKRGIQVGDVTDAMLNEDGPLTDEEKVRATAHAAFEDVARAWDTLATLANKPLDLGAAQRKLDAEVGRDPLAREGVVRALALAHLQKDFARRDHAAHVQLTGPADDRGCPPCSACEARLDPLRSFTLRAPNKNADDDTRAFEVCKGCYDRLEPADVAHKNGRLVWTQCPICQLPCKGVACSEACAARLRDELQGLGVSEEKLRAVFGVLTAQGQAGAMEVRNAGPTIRIGERTFACEVTPLPSRYSRLGRETVAGPREVRATVMFAAPHAGLLAPLERGEPCVLTERDSATRMFARAWVLKAMPKIRGFLELTVDLQELAEDAVMERVPSYVTAKDLREIPIVPLPAGAESVFAEATRRADEIVDTAIRGASYPRASFGGIPFPEGGRMSLPAERAHAASYGTVEDMERKGAVRSPASRATDLAFGGSQEGGPARLTSDGVFSCPCGTDAPESHRECCKLPWWAREVAAQAYRVFGQRRRMREASAAAKQSMEAVAVVAVLTWFCRLWDASPAGQLAARDAAVEKAVAEVPAGCDAGRWGNVVRTIAADLWELQAGRDGFDSLFRYMVHETGVNATRYAALRAQLFGHEAAVREVLRIDGYEVRPAMVRLLAAYEAGR